MGLGRFMVTLLDEEHQALWELAAREHRDVRDQAALAIRRDLERRGLLAETAEADQDAEQEVLLCYEVECQRLRARVTELEAESDAWEKASVVRLMARCQALEAEVARLRELDTARGKVP